MPLPEHAWMVRAGNQNELADVVLDKKVVAIGWPDVGDLSRLTTREQVRQRYQEAFPEESAGSIAVNAGQLYRFACEIAVGDYALTYIKATREYLVGLIQGPYQYREHGLLNHYPHVRSVDWQHRISRDSFSAPARNSLGSTLTVFNLDRYLPEIHRLALQEVSPKETPSEEEEAPPFFQEVKAQADELISDLISRLHPYEFQDLVAGVLEAMGYRAVSSPPGPDRGVDIVAHRDALGFEGPRIKAQVKHRQGSATGPEMRSFVGALDAGDKGLFVSTGGFTRDATREADRSREPLTMLDRDDFIRLLLENYEALDPEFKAMVPLRRVWISTE